MPASEHHERITNLVDGYLQGNVALAEYLGTVDPALRDEVHARCEEAAFIGEFFDRRPGPSPRLDRPDTIGGCRLLRLLGEGAMGEVHGALQVDLGREVAVKLVRAELAHRDDLLERFRKEAQTLANLDHPGIVKVLACGHEQGWHYFVMDLVPGQSLADATPQLRRDLLGGTAARAFDQIARIVAELLETLAYAHGRGIVHRDLKPSNVMLEPQGHVRLVDFGLAKNLVHSANETPGAKSRTAAGLLLGTPAYLSPEIAARRDLSPEQADLWAVAVMLYQLLLGRLPYDGETSNELLAALSSPRWIDLRRSEPRMPSGLAAICRRALAPAVLDRYASAQQFAADLRRFLAREPVHAEQRFTLAQCRRHLWRRRHRYIGAAGLAAIVGVAWLTAIDVENTRRTGAVVRELMASAAPERGRLAALAEVASTARRLLRGDSLTAADHETVAARLTTIEQAARQQHQNGMSMLQRGAGSPRGTAIEASFAPTPALQVEGLRLIADAAVVLPELPGGAQVEHQFLPVLHIDAPIGVSDAPVRVDALEAATGQPVSTIASATAPCDITAPPGQYRVLVGTTQAFAECTRSVLAPGTYVVTPQLVATAVAQAGMILIAAGTAQIGSDGPDAFIYHRQTITHAAFFIDRTEVTCGEYHDYCLATGAALPGLWSGAYDPTWTQLPVLGVTAVEASRYAEWRGKRLPTWTEWQIAARGPTGFLYPWGDDPARLTGFVGLGGDQATPWYLGVHAVGTVALDSSWCGALDMLGNVDEWTETVYVAQFEGMPFAVYPWRVRGGARWWMKRDRNAALDVVGPGQPESFDSGFRCAKSADF